MGPTTLSDPLRTKPCFWRHSFRGRNIAHDKRGYSCTQQQLMEIVGHRIVLTK